MSRFLFRRTFSHSWRPRGPPMRAFGRRGGSRSSSAMQTDLSVPPTPTEGFFFFVFFVFFRRAPTASLRRRASGKTSRLSRRTRLRLARMSRCACAWSSRARTARIASGFGRRSGDARARARGGIRRDYSARGGLRTRGKQPAERRRFFHVPFPNSNPRRRSVRRVASPRPPREAEIPDDFRFPRTTRSAFPNRRRARRSPPHARVRARRAPSRGRARFGREQSDAQSRARASRPTSRAAAVLSAHPRLPHRCRRRRRRRRAALGTQPAARAPSADALLTHSPNRLG